MTVQDLEVERVIGRGGNGVVSAVRLRSSRYALKQVSMASADVERTRQEIQLLQQVTGRRGWHRD